jgi:N6-adenosine-specific RNA methylase IME4
MIPNELIRYNLFAPRPDLEDKPENYFVMSYVLTPEGENTKLEIIQEDNRPGAQQEEPHDEENPVLQALKNVVDTI